MCRLCLKGWVKERESGAAPRSPMPYQRWSRIESLNLIMIGTERRCRNKGK